MGKSLRVTEAEYRAGLRLVRELCELPRDPGVRSEHLLRGLCGVVGARAGSDVTSRRIGGGGTRCREVCTGGVVVGLDGGELRVVAGYLRDLEPPDPLAAWLYPRVEAGAAPTLARGQILGDDGWRGSAHYNEVRVPAGIAEPLIHSRPGAGPTRGSVRTFCLHRGPGERPFGRREAQLLGLLIDEALRAVDQLAAGVEDAAGPPPHAVPTRARRAGSPAARRLGQARSPSG